MWQFVAGVIIGFLLGLIVSADAQFYPGMDPNMRDLQFQRMYQEQEQDRIQDFQSRSQQQWQKPC